MIDPEVEALSERIEMAQITNQVLKERIDKLFAKLDYLQDLIASED